MSLHTCVQVLHHRKGATGEVALHMAAAYLVIIASEWLLQFVFTELVITMKRIHKHITIHHPPHNSIRLH